MSREYTTLWTTFDQTTVRSNASNLPMDNMVQQILRELVQNVSLLLDKSWYVLVEWNTGGKQTFDWKWEVSLDARFLCYTIN